MGVNDLGVFEIGDLGTCFCYMGECQIVWFDAILLYFAEESEGFVGITTVYSFSYAVIPLTNS